VCKSWTAFTSKISDWLQVDASEIAVTSALASTAPLSVLLDASGLQFYKSGVYTPRECSTTDLNHAVLLVGYNTTTEGAPYYSLKNSWSESWGEDGYFRISREVGDTGPGTCGIQSSVTSAIA
jgi:cathepsin L